MGSQRALGHREVDPPERSAQSPWLALNTFCSFSRMDSVTEPAEERDAGPRIRYFTGVLEQRAGQSLLFDGSCWLRVAIDADVDTSELTGFYERWVVTFGHGTVTARPWSVSRRGRSSGVGREQPGHQGSETAIAGKVAVLFTESVEGVDPDDGVAFRSTRHKVNAVWSRQDRDETLFMDDEGEIVAKWPTRLVQRIDWGAHSRRDGTALASAGSDTVDKAAWQRTIRSEHACAYSHWTVAEEQALRSKWSKRLPIGEIGRLHARPLGEIEARLVRLGLVDPILSGRVSNDEGPTALERRPRSLNADGSRVSESTPSPSVGSREWLDRVKSDYPCAYEDWSAEEDQRLRGEWEAGVPVAEISKIHERTRGAIRARLARLGLR
jgi:hypothetical protein